MNFYYSRKKLFELFVLSLLVFGVALYSVYFFSMRVGVATVILCFPILFVWASLYVFLCPPRVAKIDKRAIQIDRAVPLLWSDVKSAHKTTSNPVCGRDIIVFELKPRVIYPLTWMQEFCKSTRFTAFSIPLYAMSEKDQKAICKEIAKHCKIKED